MNGSSCCTWKENRERPAGILAAVERLLSYEPRGTSTQREHRSNDVLHCKPSFQIRDVIYIPWYRAFVKTSTQEFLHCKLMFQICAILSLSTGYHEIVPCFVALSQCEPTAALGTNLLAVACTKQTDKDMSPFALRGYKTRSKHIGSCLSAAGWAGSARVESQGSSLWKWPGSCMLQTEAVDAWTVHLIRKEIS